MLPPKIKAVLPLPQAKIKLEYVDGQVRIFDMEPYLSQGVFRDLREPSLFASVHPVLGSVAWANGADVDPEVLFEDSVPEQGETDITVPGPLRSTSGREESKEACESSPTLLKQIGAGLTLVGRGEAMPTISMFYGIIISMYLKGKEHGPPHIHADYAEFAALFDIAEGSQIQGDLPRRQRRLVEAWIELHREELLADWRLSLNGDAPERIEPLR
jgi:hypothetical protein